MGLVVVANPGLVNFNKCQPLNCVWGQMSVFVCHKVPPSTKCTFKEDTGLRAAQLLVCILAKFWPVVQQDYLIMKGVDPWKYINPWPHVRPIIWGRSCRQLLAVVSSGLLVKKNVLNALLRQPPLPLPLLKESRLQAMLSIRQYTVSLWQGG